MGTTATQDYENNIPANSENDDANSDAVISAENDALAYYDLLDSEYQKSLKTGCFESCIVDNKAYFYGSEINFTADGDKISYGFVSYDFDTEETKIIVLGGYISYLYSNGLVYCTDWGNVYCYDLDGSLVKKSKVLDEINPLYLLHIMEDGTTFTTDTRPNSISYNTRKYYMVSSIYKTVSDLPTLSGIGAHNKTTSMSYRIMGSIGDELYVCGATYEGDWNLYTINLKTLEQKDFKNIKFTKLGEYYLIGKYAIALEIIGNNTRHEYQIYDTETGELIGTSCLGNYKGGNASYSASNGARVVGTTYIYEAPLNEEMGIKDGTMISANWAQIIPLDSTRYVIKDEHGTFICEVGSEEEIEIIYPES